VCAPGHEQKAEQRSGGLRQRLLEQARDEQPARQHRERGLALLRPRHLFFFPIFWQSQLTLKKTFQKCFVNRNLFRNKSEIFVISETANGHKQEQHKSKTREGEEMDQKSEKPAPRTVQLNLHQAILAQARQKAEQQQTKANNQHNNRKQRGNNNKNNQKNQNANVVNVGQLVSSISVLPIPQIKSPKI
jgi:hypothetical protein